MTELAMVPTRLAFGHYGIFESTAHFEFQFVSELIFFNMGSPRGPPLFVGHLRSAFIIHCSHVNI